MNLQDWVRVGPPLIEQDAEFLRTLIEEEDCPARIECIGDTDDGCSHFVMVHRRHLPIANEARARYFAETTKPEHGHSPNRFATISLVASFAGFIVGATLGGLLRGSAFVAVIGGAGMAMCAFLATLAVYSTRLGIEPPKVTPTQTTRPAPASTNSDRRKAA